MEFLLVIKRLYISYWTVSGPEIQSSVEFVMAYVF